MRKFIVMAAAVALLYGCTSGGDDDSGGSSSGDGGGESSAEASRAPGVTADTLEVGVSYIDLDAISELTNIDHGDYQAAYQALIDDTNANGGINGRSVEPVFAPVNPIGTQPAEEACLRLTEDEQVFAAIGFFSGDAPLCYVDTHDTAVVGGQMTPDRLARAVAPWYTTAAGSDFHVDAIRAFAEEGLLEGNVAVFGTTLEEQLLRDEVEPLLDELGVDPTEVAVLDAPEDDAAAQNAATQTIAERFDASGVDTVIVVGNAGLSWANALESGDYRPQLMFTERNTIAAFFLDAAARDLSLLEGSYAGGFLGGTPEERFDDEVMQECIGILEDAGIEVPDPADVPVGEPELFVSAFQSCEIFTLFSAIAEAAGDDLNYATFRAAGDELGELEIPGFPEPFEYGAPPSADGDPAVGVLMWDATETEFVPAK